MNPAAAKVVGGSSGGVITNNYNQRHRILTVRILSQLLSSNVFTSEQLCTYCYNLALCGEQIWNLNAFSRLVPFDELIDNARRADHERQQRNGSNHSALSMLHGIPISIKANLAVSSQCLTAGSRILGEGQQNDPSYIATTDDGKVLPCGYDSDAAHILLRNCNAILIGMNNMDEFGMGSYGTNVIKNSMQPTKNPIPYITYLLQQQQQKQQQATTTTSVEEAIVNEICNKSKSQIEEEHYEAYEKYCSSSDDNNCDDYSAGGSSCGSAASVKHGSSILSIGTDTGGSIRLPAAWNQIVGLKPSYGLISRHGVVPYASSFDTVGILANTVDCATIALNQLAQKQQSQSQNESNDEHISLNSLDPNASFYNPSQAASLEEQVALTGISTEEIKQSTMLSNVTIGIPEAFSIVEYPEYYKQLWQVGINRLEQYGATIKTIPTNVISQSIIQKSLAAYYVLVSAEASSNLARYDGFRYGVASSSSSSSLSDNDDGSSSSSSTKRKKSLLQQQYANNRTDGFGMEVIRRVLCGTSVLSSDHFHTHYENAAKLRAILIQQFQQALNNNADNDAIGGGDPNDGVDYLFIPTNITPPFQFIQQQQHQNYNKRSNRDDNNDNNKNDDNDNDYDDHNNKEESIKINNTEMFLNDIMTVPISLAGLPSISVPIQMNSSEKMHQQEEDIISSLVKDKEEEDKEEMMSNDPLKLFPAASFQLVAPRLQEGNLVQVARLLESMNP